MKILYICSALLSMSISIYAQQLVRLPKDRDQIRSKILSALNNYGPLTTNQLKNIVAPAPSSINIYRHMDILITLGVVKRHSTFPTTIIIWTLVHEAYKPEEWVE